MDSTSSIITALATTATAILALITVRALYWSKEPILELTWGRQANEPHILTGTITIRNRYPHELIILTLEIKKPKNVNLFVRHPRVVKDQETRTKIPFSTTIQPGGSDDRQFFIALAEGCTSVQSRIQLSVNMLSTSRKIRTKRKIIHSKITLNKPK